MMNVMTSRAWRMPAILALQLALLPCGPVLCRAAFEGNLVDSRAGAFGDCWCVSDFSALSIAPVPPPGRGFAVGLSYRRPFGLRDLEENRLVVNLPLASWTGSVGYAERGGGFYRERALTATMSAAARSARAGQVSLCASAAVYEVSVEGWSSARCASLSAGARASPVSPVDVCVGLGNVVYGENDVGLRQTFLAGVVARPHEVLTLAAEVRRQPGETSSCHLGAELRISGGAFLRCGLRTEPLELTMGFGIGLRSLGLDAASSFHPVLGRTDSFSLSFSR